MSFMPIAGFILRYRERSFFKFCSHFVFITGSPYDECPDEIIRLRHGYVLYLIEFRISKCGNCRFKRQSALGMNQTDKMFSDEKRAEQKYF